VAGGGATGFSVALLGAFIRLGVRDIVVAPGSRSQALALAAEAYERAGGIRLHVRIDERSAGFLALGLAVESGVPVLVVTTSGTAVANLHPAVLEARHSGVPLILLTADRPQELHGIGSNQTTVQAGMFGSAVPFVRDVEAPSDDTGGGSGDGYPAELAAEAFSAAAGHSGHAGPVQLNLAFREPLSGAMPPLDDAPAASPPPRSRPALPVEELSAAPRTVVIAGHGAGEQAEEAARALGAPLLAEVSSGARYGPNLVAAYRPLLADPAFGGRVERAVVFGHPTLSREVPALLERDGVHTIVVRGPGFEDYDPGRRAARFAGSVVVAGDPDPDRSWVGGWVVASRRLLEGDGDDPLRDARTDDPAAVARFAKAQLETFREPVTRRMLVEAVWRATWPHDRLVFGASRLIREADMVVPGKRIAVHANRGLAGIDGTVATASGIAIASQAEASDRANSAAGITRVLLGDLAVLHDAGSLLVPPGETRPRLQIIVGNDGGGTIFDGLEVAGTSGREAFDRVLYTPQAVDLSALAAAYGWEHRYAGNRGELDEALGSSAALIEVPLTR